MATDVQFDTFNAISVDDVITSIRRLPDKTSAADPTVFYLLAPYITEMFNRSKSSDQVPQCFKHAFITLTVKKAGLDGTDLNSYQPISNLSVLSKTLEHLIARQLLAYLRVHNLLLSRGFFCRVWPDRRSGTSVYRPTTSCFQPGS
jgi:hypothetical protein